MTRTQHLRVGIRPSPLGFPVNKVCLVLRTLPRKNAVGWKVQTVRHANRGEDRRGLERVEACTVHPSTVRSER